MLQLPHSLSLELEQIKVLVRGMYAVASCNGISDAEQVLLREIYEGFRHDVAGPIDYEEVISTPLDPASARLVLRTPQQRNLFLQLCVLVAWVDRQLSDEERAILTGYAEMLGISTEHLSQLQDEVRQAMLREVLTKEYSLSALAVFSRALS